MRCDEFEARWNQLLDERRRPALDDRLQAHAMVCRQCHELLTGEARLFQLLEGDAAAPNWTDASLGMRDGIEDGVSDWSSEVPASLLHMGNSLELIGQRKNKLTPLSPGDLVKRQRAGVRKLAAAALAGALLVASLPLIMRVALAPSGGSALVHSAADTAAAQESVAEAVTLPPSHPWQPSPSSGSVANAPSLPIPTVVTTANGDPDELRHMMRQLWANIPDVARAPLQPIDRIAGGIWPVASTLAAAWDALRRSIPAGPDGAPEGPQALHYLPHDRPFPASA
jgi:hypothetical protein